MKHEAYINFAGSDWGAIKGWLSKTREAKIGMLIGATSQTDSDKLRGAISIIDQLLKLEKTAQTEP